MDFMQLQISPEAFWIGSFPVRWYALAYLSGFLLGWKYCLILVKEKYGGTRPNNADIDNFVSWAVIGVILGGRLGYVLFYNFEYYMADPYEIIMITNGGMSFHGGLTGVAVAMFGYSYKHKISLFKLSDIICAAAPIGLFFGRIANFINAELYGKVTTVSWGVIFPGQTEARHPSQIYEAFSEGLILFLIMFILIKKSNLPAGFVSGAFLIGYGVFRASIELVREPDQQIGVLLDMITMGQLLCIPMIIAGIIVIKLAYKQDLKAAQVDDAAQ